MKTISKLIKVLFIFLAAIIIIAVILFGHQDIPLEELKAKYAKAPSSFIAVDGMNVHFRDEGNPNDSIPIVLIHGTGSSLHTFDGWTAELKKEYRVIRMDLPAYGLTGPFPDRNYSMEHYAEFIYNFLTAIEVDKCVIGGNSLGGGIAWKFTDQYTDMVDKLILIDATGYPAKSQSVPIAFKAATIPMIKNVFTYITPKSMAKSSVENVYADKSKVTEALVDRYFELTLREGNRQAFVDRLNMKRDTTAYRNIKNISQRTLILWGDQDRLIPLENAYKFQQDLPNDTLVILKNIGHVPMEESPKLSLGPVMSFLKN